MISKINWIVSVLLLHGPRVLAHRILWKIRDQRIYPPMLLAYRYCKGQGIELGAAGYNPFDLPGCINVAPFSEDKNHPNYADFLIYKEEQIRNFGRYLKIDLSGEADNIPVQDHSQDYVISSHVVEHVPNLICAFEEWNRVLKSGGIVFMIFPKRNALSQDEMRPITSLAHFVEDYQSGQTVDTHPIPDGDRIRGHYHVFTLESMLELINWCNKNIGLSWQVLVTEQTDSKVGNGHTVVCRWMP